MHETDLEALFVADAVAALRAHGWQIVPIDEAYRDPIAAAEPDSPYLATRIGALASLPGQPHRDLSPTLEPGGPGHRGVQPRGAASAGGRRPRRRASTRFFVIPDLIRDP